MTAARTMRPLAAALLLLASAAAPVRAADDKPAWDPARTTSPDSVEELKALQERVKAVVKKDLPSTVGLFALSGAGSGVIVSEDGLVLTAAHVITDQRTFKVIKDIVVVLPSGKRVKGKALGVNIKLDSGMVKITDKPPEDADWPGAAEGKWPAVRLGDSTSLKAGQWVVSLGHPGGPKKDRPPPVRVGRYEGPDQTKDKNATVLRTDCTLVGGDSGGPLFDLNGKLVGIHSRIGIFLDANMHVPLKQFQKEWDKLESGSVLEKPNPVDLGLTLDPDEDAPTVKAVGKTGPAAEAGIKPGDVITRFDGEKVTSTEDLVEMLNNFTPGETVTVEVQRGDEKLKFKLTLAQKPRRPRRP